MGTIKRKFKVSNKETLLTVDKHSGTNTPTRE